jgi:hypothetical protein
MDPHSQWCHNRRCRAYGRISEGHIVIHSQKERRYRCKRCGRTFSETTDTVLYRIHKPKWLVVAVVTVLAHGCPVQAIELQPSSSMSAPSPVGKENPERSASGYTSTL